MNCATNCVTWWARGEDYGWAGPFKTRSEALRYIDLAEHGDVVLQVNDFMVCANKEYT